jgi:hypothetical protein
MGSIFLVHICSLVLFLTVFKYKEKWIKYVFSLFEHGEVDTSWDALTQVI